MSPWQPLPLSDDPDDVSAQIMSNLAAAVPGWTAREGSLDTAIVEEIGRSTADTNARTITAADVAAAGVMQSLHGLPPQTGTAASLPVTFTVVAAGVVIPAGYAVSGISSVGAAVAFTLPASITTTSTTATATLSATLVGAAGNGVPAGGLSTITAALGVVTVVATGPSSGGVDPETIEDFLSRAVAYLSILAPGAVQAPAVAQVARNVAGVQRALAIDLYDATTSTSNVARTVSVFGVDANGAALTSGVKTALAAALAAVREVNFVFRVADPHFTAVSVTWTAVANSGASGATVSAAINAAVLGYLSPARWGGSVAGLDAGGHATDWAETLTVRYLDLARVAGGATGVAYLTGFTLNGGTSDVTLTGPAALPSAASTCSGTISATVP